MLLKTPEIRRWVAATTLALAAACGSKSATPTDPTPATNAPQITCPGDVSVRGVSGGSQATTFSAPAVTGGAPPVGVICTPASGSTFALGSTPVSCRAIDAQSRQATCSFTVTLTGLALAVTKYQTLGDSLTAGENGLPLGSIIDPPNAYPTKLQGLLDAAYPGQGVAVVNRGMNGERIELTVDRLADNLTRDRPQAVLLLGGYNNLTMPCSRGQVGSSACQSAMNEVESGIREFIQRVKQSPVGVKHVFVSTLTPAGAVAPNAKDLRIALEATQEVNRRIRIRVAEEHVTLVDTYPLFVGHETDYISVDGLHLKPAGYQAIADAFFAAIKATVPQTPLLTKGSAE